MIEERTSRYEETQRFGRRRAPIGSITIIWKKLPPRAMAIVNTASHKQLVAARTRSCPIGSRKCWPHSRHPNPADGKMPCSLPVRGASAPPYATSPDGDSGLLHGGRRHAAPADGWRHMSGSRGAHRDPNVRLLRKAGVLESQAGHASGFSLESL